METIRNDFEQTKILTKQIDVLNELKFKFTEGNKMNFHTIEIISEINKIIIKLLDEKMNINKNLNLPF